MFWLLVGTALAWETTGEYWTTDTLVFQATDEDLPGVDDEVGAVQAALQTWSDGGCQVDLQLTFGGLVPADDHPWSVDDDLNTIVLSGDGRAGDPPGDTATREIVGTDELRDTDIILNDQLAFTDDPSDSCTEAFDVQDVVTHELGHALGLDHDGEPGSVMATDAVPCSDDRTTLKPDDHSGLSFLYGALALPRCWVGEPGVLAGGVPLEVTCEALEVGPVVGDTAAEWDLDGTEATGVEVEQTFDTEGAWIVEGCVTSGDEPGCIPQCNAFELLACNPPEARFSVKSNGGVLTMVNDSPIGLEGCLTDVRWELLDSEDQLVWTSEAWEPSVAVPEGGPHTMRLSVRGPGGEGVAEQRVGGCGCITAPGSAAPVALMLLLPLWMRRRN